MTPEQLKELEEISEVLFRTIELGTKLQSGSMLIVKDHAQPTLDAIDRLNKLIQDEKKK